MSSTTSKAPNTVLTSGIATIKTPIGEMFPKGTLILRATKEINPFCNEWLSWVSFQSVIPEPTIVNTGPGVRIHATKRLPDNWIALRVDGLSKACIEESDGRRRGGMIYAKAVSIGLSWDEYWRIFELYKSSFSVTMTLADRLNLANEMYPHSRRTVLKRTTDGFEYVQTRTRKADGTNQTP